MIGFGRQPSWRRLPCSEPVAEVIREGLPASRLHWSPVAATGEVITILTLALLPRYVGCEPTAGAHCPRSSADQGF